MTDRLLHPLAFLLDGLSEESFLAGYHEQAPLRCHPGEPARFADLLTLQGVDAFIDGADLRAGMVDLARNGRRVAPESFTNADGRIIASAVAEEYLNGATIILPHLQDSLLALGDLCRALEAIFSCHVQSNAYLTPGGQSGFAPHQDGHDVFVLQISGTKDWQLYDRRPPAALREQAVANDENNGDAREAFTLEPGDSLYLPRGFVHAAENAGREPSLHITIGLISRTWAELILAAVTQVVRTEPAFARALPPRFAQNGFDTRAARPEFEALMSTLAGNADMERAFGLLGSDFLHKRRPRIAGIITAGADVPTAGERYRRRPLVLWRLSKGPQGPLLIGSGGDLQFDGNDRSALEVALSGEVFALPQLHCPDPERLFRRLWANGYLETASAGWLGSGGGT